MSAIYESLIEQGFTREQARLALIGWEIVPIMQGDKQVGEIMLRNNEAHFAISREHRMKTGRLDLISKTLDKLLETRPFIVTKLFLGDRNKKLIERIGFRRTHMDDKFEYYWLDEETRYARH